MLKLNWIIILGIVILLVFLYINNSEHFAGAVTTLNPEAIRNISSVYNTDNLTATNITASNKLNLNTKFSLSGDADNYFRLKNKDGTQVFAVGQGTDSYLNTLYLDTLNAGAGNLVKGPNNNKFVFHTPDDDRKGLWIAPDKGNNTSDWDWGKALNLRRDGNHYLGGNLNFITKPIIMKTYNNVTNGWADTADMWVNSQMNATEYPVYAIGQFYQDGYYTNNDWAGEAPIKAKIENGNWMFKVNNGNKIGNKWNMSITFFHKSIAASQ